MTQGQDSTERFFRGLGVDKTARQIQAAQALLDIEAKATQDEHRGEVLGVIYSEAFPAGLRQAMKQDGALFMSMYDTVRTTRGYGPFFRGQF